MCCPSALPRLVFRKLGAALGVVLSMELFGMAVGSLVIGNVPDNYGRRTTILLCLVILATGMYAAAIASDVIELSMYRLATGLGIGGMLAATNAMTAECSNQKYRAMAVVVMAAGYPFGAIVGGAYASELLVEWAFTRSLRWLFQPMYEPVVQVL